MWLLKGSQRRKPEPFHQKVGAPPPPPPPKKRKTNNTTKKQRDSTPLPPHGALCAAPLVREGAQVSAALHGAREAAGRALADWARVSGGKRGGFRWFP